MNKVCILGCPGSGKSTFAQKLSETTGLPVYYLDTYFWKPGWVETEHEEWVPIVNDLVRNDKWIIDGNYERSQDTRFMHADTIILLDLPRYKCLFNAFKRVLLHWGKNRIDMAEGCYEHFDFSFYKWIWGFKKNDGRKTMERLAKLSGQKKIVTLESHKEMEMFLKRIGK